ncbi:MULTISPECIES: FHA domain-containing protein [unclassified Streptomyces]|uniref:FHA domain-containing protein n=1 Tax=unclassified Streptomyces TaxID=2593676 RepID=UPI003716DADC
MASNWRGTTAGLTSIPPNVEVEIGEIRCRSASRQTLEAAGLAGTEGEPTAFSVVLVPVVVRRRTQLESATDLVVRATLRAPRGRRPASASAPTPTAAFIDVQESRTGNVALKPPVLEVSHGFNRSATRQLLLRDVAGAGTSNLEWFISGQQTPLSGSYEFSFLVRQDDASYGWVDVTAELHQTRPGRRTGRSPAAMPAAASATAPLIADTAPQAPTTLTLYEGEEDNARPFFVGRPLDLPLATGDQGLSLAPQVANAGAVPAGSLRWFDDIEGRPGFTWLHRSPTAAVLIDRQPRYVAQGESVHLENGSVLRFGPQQSLRVAYEVAESPGIGTLKTFLEIQVFIDSEVADTYSTTSDYVTIGRTHRDISIDHPDISRTHATLELDSDGWSYWHKSAQGAARLVRNGVEVALVRRGEAQPVRSGDQLLLTVRTSLLIK